MAYRKTVLATNQIYHIYNRGVERRSIFLNKKDYSRFIDLINYYRFKNCPVKFSHFKLYSIHERTKIIENLQNESQRLIDILAFCLMPNHIHFLVRQLTNNGISKFMAKVTSGYSHYFNIRHERVGHLFQGNFGAVRIENDEQLTHVSRYIHLNPVSSYIIEIRNLREYTYSSYLEYIKKKNGLCETQTVLGQFRSADAYTKFIFDQADYARQLANIKHLLMEE